MFDLKFRYKNILMAGALLAISAVGCTDLEEKVIDEIVSGDISEVEGAEASLLAATYSKSESIFGDYGGSWCLQEMTTDEAMLPVRGEDWRDGGKWKMLHEFGWDASSVKVEDNWLQLNGAIAQAASAINVIKSSSIAERNLYLAEARGMWALYSYNLVDLFGQMPYRDPMNLTFVQDPVIMDTQDAISIIVNTLYDIIPDLATIGTQGTHAGRFTKEGAYALLAKIYLNKAVYNDRYNASSSFDFTANNNMDSVIYFANKLIDSPAFDLEPDYFEIFGVDNQNNSELILAYIQKATGANTGQNDFTYLSMGRNQKANPENNRGSNATCTTPDYLATWDGNTNDPRYHKHTIKNGGEAFKNDGTDYSLPYDGTFHFNRGFQEGQQYGPIIVNGAFEMDPDAAGRVLVQMLYTEKTQTLPMDFTRELNFDVANDAAFSQNQINRGVRVFKQEYDAENTRSKGGVDISIFRLGGIYTMRAEALYRKGNVPGALADINTLRTSRFSIDKEGNRYYGQPIETLDEETLYNEISYEMYWEGERRQEMIRFGTFDKAYTAKPATEPMFRVFPIPQSELDVNKNYIQNKDY
nr:RagB/SusD family nutrient uptake outer membrane protein [uncultured Carboxylicivirga sp.]